MDGCKCQHCLKEVSYTKSKITTTITTTMSRRATITPTTGPTALLLLLLSTGDYCGEATIIIL